MINHFMLRHISKYIFVVSLSLATVAQLFGADPSALGFFNNYFLTGDYTVGGVGLRGKGVIDTVTQGIVGGTANTYATGSISINGVPASAQVVGAFLYWQTLQSGTVPGATSPAAKGTFRGQRISGKLAGVAQSCWSSGGGSGTTSGSEEVRTYRADVLRHLPIVNKVRVANGTHIVSLLDSGAGGSQSVGTSNQFARTQGASLVVIYRDLSQTDPQPRLKSIVLYDGAYTFSQTNPSMIHTVRGFYQQLAASDVKAKMTHIIGDGDPNFRERLFFNSTALTAPLVASETDPIRGAQGQAWDSLEVDVSSFMSGVTGGSFTTSVAPVISAIDCMSWSAIVFSTDVQDTDNDGLLDKWEDDKGYTDQLTSKWVPLPGADRNKQDLYMEIDHMVSRDASGGLLHSHRPKNGALSLVASAFSRTELNVNLHLDVGPVYLQGQSPTDPARPAHILPAADSKGGDEINEKLLLACNATNTCPPVLPDSILGWRRGFQLIKTAKTAKGNPASSRFFEPSRRHAYHYAIFGHALGRKGVLSKISGIADKPGANLLITLGQWRFDDPANCVKDPTMPLSPGQRYCNDRVGNLLSQAGTLMHELGHNTNLSHGGFETLNCKPNHVSVMNYMFQVRGVPKGDGTLGIDFSYGRLNPLSETALQEQGPLPLGTEDLRTRWYGPPSPVDLKVNAVLQNRLAKRYCDGTPFDPNQPTPQMVRIDGSSRVNMPVDWNNNGVNNGAAILAQDVNFSGGPLTGPYLDSNDWARAKRNLRQVAGAQSWTRVSSGIRDWTDLGLEDVGLEDVGLEDVGLEDVGLEDVGLEDVGLEDVGLEDVGLEDVGEVDYDIAASTVDPPSGLLAVNGTNYVDLTWTAPDFGTVYQYAVWRDPGTKGKGGLELLGTVSGSNGAPPAGYFRDTTVKNNVTYSYFVSALACDSAKNSCKPGDLIQSPLSAALIVVR